MKSPIIFLYTILLILCNLGKGCERNDNPETIDTIVGTWEWLYTLGGFIGQTYPNEGETTTWNFAEDGAFTRELNGIIMLETTYFRSGDTIWYRDSMDYRYLSKISGDTLELLDLNSNLSFAHFFKHTN
jgi:hypothetical protein